MRLSFETRKRLNLLAPPRVSDILNFDTSVACTTITSYCDAPRSLPTAPSLPSQTASSRLCKRIAPRGDLNYRVALAGLGEVRLAPPVRPCLKFREESIQKSMGDSDRPFQLRQDLEEVGNDPIIGNLEYRRVGVRIDRHNHLGILHSGQVLDSA